MFRKSLKMFFCLALVFSIPCSVQAYSDQVEKIAATISKDISGSNKKVAVVDFTDLQGNVTELGRFLAEEFSVALSSVGKGFEVIDRTHLKSIIKEHKLSSTGIMNADTARQLGKIAGVNALITGTMTPFSDTIRITVKILDTESAKILGAETGNIPKTSALAELVNRDIQEEQEEIASREKESSRSKQDLSSLKTEIKGFSFAVISCTQSGSSLKVGLLVTSHERDKRLKIWEETEMYDNFGNQYSIKSVLLGNKIGENRVESLLVSGVPTKLILTFEGVDEKSSSISLLKIKCISYTLNSDSFYPEIRNIPIKK